MIPISPDAKLVLVVETDERIAELVGIHLEVNGYEARTASSAPQALEMLSGARFCAVITELVLDEHSHGMSIVDHCTERFIPVVILTALSPELASSLCPLEVPIIDKMSPLHALIQQIRRVTGMNSERPCDDGVDVTSAG